MNYNLIASKQSGDCQLPITVTFSYNTGAFVDVKIDHWDGYATSGGQNVNYPQGTFDQVVVVALSTCSDTDIRITKDFE